MQMLVENPFERDVKFVGTVRGVAVDLDPTNRTEVLRAIDLGKLEKRLVRSVRPEHDAVLCMNAFMIKVHTKDGTEKIEVPIHQVAALSYVNEDELHIIGIKYGDFEILKKTTSDEAQTCYLAVLYCASKKIAKEICTVADHFFHIAYTDVTMRFFDKSRVEKALSEASSVYYNKSSCSTPNILDDNVLPKWTSPASESILTIASRKSSEDELSPAANELIMDYMTKLYTKLNPNELQQFAELVKAWHTDLQFSEFCNKVRNLYGLDRKHLLADMRPFIPAKDSAFFDQFIRSLGLEVNNDSDFATMRLFRSSSMFSPSMTGSMMSGIESYDDRLSDTTDGFDRLSTRHDF